jgi:hypothetical protein
LAAAFGGAGAIMEWTCGHRTTADPSVASMSISRDKERHGDLVMTTIRLRDALAEGVRNGAFFHRSV